MLKKMQAWVAWIPVNSYFKASVEEDWVLMESPFPIFVQSTSIDNFPLRGRFFTKEGEAHMSPERVAPLFKWLKSRPKYQGQSVVSVGPYFKAHCKDVLDEKRPIRFARLLPESS